LVLGSKRSIRPCQADGAGGGTKKKKKNRKLGTGLEKKKNENSRKTAGNTDTKNKQKKGSKNRDIEGGGLTIRQRTGKTTPGKTLFQKEKVKEESLEGAKSRQIWERLRE